MTTLFSAETRNDVIRAINNGANINIFMVVHERGLDVDTYWVTPLYVASKKGIKNHTSLARYDWRRI